MSVPVGITVPKLLPITGTFAPAFALYYTILSYRVSKQRLDSEQWIGDKNTKSSSTVPEPSTDALYVATRCQQNFTENVPLALFLTAVAEMNGGNRKVLTGGLASLLLFRILHVELGLRKKDGKGNESMGIGRPIGHSGTMLWVLGSAAYAGWLVKGYWGF